MPNHCPATGFLAQAPALAPKTVALALSFALLLAATLQGEARAEPWTLDRVLDQVRAEDPGVKAAEAQGRAGRAEGGAAWSALLPRLRFDAGLLRTDDPAILFSEKLWQGRFSQEDFALDALNYPDPETAIQYGFVLEQPIWNRGAEWTSPALAGHLGAAASAQEEALKADHLLGAVETYVGAARAREALEADSLALAAARENWRSAVGLHTTGQVAELDTLLAAAHAGEVELGWLDSRKNYAVSLDRLSKLVGAPIATSEVAGLEPSSLPILPDMALASTYADQHGNLRAAEERAEVLGIESRRSAYAFAPSVNSRFAYTWYRPWDDGGSEDRWSAGLGLSWPLFDGGHIVRERQMATARAEAARAEAAILRRNLTTAATQAREEYAIADERLQVTKTARAAAEEALRLASARYAAGLLPQSELLAAEAGAARARQNEVDAAAGLILSHYRYLHSIGALR
jgi:outer membrane protein TolC